MKLRDVLGFLSLAALADGGCGGGTTGASGSAGSGGGAAGAVGTAGAAGTSAAAGTTGAAGNAGTTGTAGTTGGGGTTGSGGSADTMMNFFVSSDTSATANLGGLALVSLETKKFIIVSRAGAASRCIPPPPVVRCRWVPALPAAPVVPAAALVPAAPAVPTAPAARRPNRRSPRRPWCRRAAAVRRAASDRKGLISARPESNDHRGSKGKRQKNVCREWNALDKTGRGSPGHARAGDVPVGRGAAQSNRNEPTS